MTSEPEKLLPVIRETGAPCEACGKPVEVGQVVLCYDDAGEMHADCERPFALDPTRKQGEPEPFVLIGSPMRHVALSRLSSPVSGTDMVKPDPACHESGWSARKIDGRWCVGMTGNLDTVHDAAVIVNQHASDDTEAQRIAQWIAAQYTSASPSTPIPVATETLSQKQAREVMMPQSGACASQGSAQSYGAPIPVIAEAGEREAIRLAYKTGHAEGYTDATDDGTGNGYCDHDAAEEGWQQYNEKLGAETVHSDTPFLADIGGDLFWAGRSADVARSGGAAAALIERLVRPMVQERSRENGDAWDQADTAIATLLDRPADTDYKAAWEALSEPLSWMHDNPKLKSYWGWNLAAIANDLIARAYPDLLAATALSTPATLDNTAVEGRE